jgi:phage baseplate assembly protein W
MTIYKGFSTIGKARSFGLSDFSLAQRDLSNYFSIRKGEKLMQPNFGTIIWDMLFEPLTSETRQVVSQDVQRIVAYDPRLAVNEVIVSQLDNGLQIAIKLTYRLTNETQTMLLNFNNNNRTLTTN